MYINEREEGETEARRLSDRVAAAMDFDVYGERYASENYQVMNYGLGGSITGHLDSVGVGEDRASSESTATGGERVATFMTYLSTVAAGGRTVFPQIALSVAPEEGDAIFWFNLVSFPHFLQKKMLII